MQEEPGRGGTLPDSSCRAAAISRGCCLRRYNDDLVLRFGARRDRQASRKQSRLEAGCRGRSRAQHIGSRQQERDPEIPVGIGRGVGRWRLSVVEQRARGEPLDSRAATPLGSAVGATVGDGTDVCVRRITV